MAKKQAKKEYQIVKKRSGKYSVVKKGGSYINGEEKTKILQSEGLIKKMNPKKQAEPTPSEEPAATTESEPKAE